MNYLVTQGTKKRGRHGKGIVYLTLTHQKTPVKKNFSVILHVSTSSSSTLELGFIQMGFLQNRMKCSL
jgi:hypothetical protein